MNNQEASRLIHINADFLRCVEAKPLRDYYIFDFEGKHIMAYKGDWLLFKSNEYQLLSNQYVLSRF